MDLTVASIQYFRNRLFGSLFGLPPSSDPKIFEFDADGLFPTTHLGVGPQQLDLVELRAPIKSFVYSPYDMAEALDWVSCTLYQLARFHY
mmetsp:Transcript_62729/g.86240  ORF Transcript_62729/g.86240 Transcript_62729/m.86240 type:complete len:90 (-) Transcript_62729:39-308(-)